ncbi:MAG: helix-turn-helix domain-containing protein, partial [Gammaproteobacteria bacterium]
AMEDGQISNLFYLVQGEVELPLLEISLQRARGNQSKVAKWLGINRGTLRKLMEQYSLSSKDFKQKLPRSKTPANSSKTTATESISTSSLRTRIDTHESVLETDPITGN